MENFPVAGGGNDVAVQVRQLANGRHEGALLHVVCHAGECHIETLVTGVFDHPTAAAASAERMLVTFCASVLPATGPPVRRSGELGHDAPRQSALAAPVLAPGADAGLSPGVQGFNR